MEFRHFLTKIGEACGGFVDVDKATQDMEDLIDAKIKVRYNYYGFIPAAIRIKDKDEHFFIVHIVTQFAGKLLAEVMSKYMGLSRDKQPLILMSSTLKLNNSISWETWLFRTVVLKN